VTFAGLDNHRNPGDVLDARGFIDLFAEDGVFSGIGGVSGQESYRGEQLGDVVVTSPEGNP